MLLKRFRESNEENAAMELMLANDEVQDDSYVGCFWYDTLEKELFGVSKTLHTDVPYYYSKQFDCNVRTGRALHKNIWKKEHYRGRDSRFVGDYTRIPRGRVFEFENIGFKVFVGDWINKYSEARKEIIWEFQLPEDKTEFVIDSHWDLGHGWSDDYM